ncbi:MAG TPA: hypothetical protein VFY34_03585, partial [Pyrinomonadaceae bacterium]|nr:hypothetical protein [Pyrinomonadaceae bacterium]
MKEANPPHKEGCGCSEESTTEKTVSAPDRSAVTGTLELGKKFVRPIETPTVIPRTRIVKQPEPLSEVVLREPGTIPVSVVVPTREATPELLLELRKSVLDLPPPLVKEGSGAIDVQLENREGQQVKNGTVTLDGPQGKLAVPLDPATRRFRLSDIPPGEYSIEAASAGSGRAFTRLNVRAGDVTRTSVPLDGSTVRGTT